MTMARRLVVLSGILLAGVVIVQASVSAEKFPPRERLAQIAPTLGRWRADGDVAIDDESLRVLNDDDYVSRSYLSSAGAVDLFIAYYGSQRQGGTMHSPLNCLPATGWQPMSTSTLAIDAGPKPVSATELVIQKGVDRQRVIYWYQSHGRTIASEYASKAYLVLDSIRLHRSDAALVRVVTTEDGAAAAADFIRALRPVLPRYIPD